MQTLFTINKAAAKLKIGYQYARDLVPLIGGFQYAMSDGVPLITSDQIDVMARRIALRDFSSYLRTLTKDDPNFEFAAFATSDPDFPSSGQFGVVWRYLKQKGVDHKTLSMAKSAYIKWVELVADMDTEGGDLDGVEFA